MRPTITLLWTEASDADLSSLNEAGKTHGMNVRHVCRDDLASAILGALVRGALMVAVTTDVEATQALGLGVDEVVRLGPVSRAALERSMQRARARATSRATREASLRREADADRMACSLIAAGIGHELTQPIERAGAGARIVNDAVGCLLDTHEKLVGWAVLAAPLDECQRIQRDDADAPDAAELRSIVSDLDDAVGKATLAVKLLVRTTAYESNQGPVGLREVVEEVYELLHNEIARAAAFRADFDATLEVAVSRTSLLCMLGALLAHALDAVRTLDRADARIVLRASAHDDAVLIEVGHNGAPVPSELHTSIFEQLLCVRQRSAAGLEGIRTQARRFGGDLLIVNEAEATTFRLLVPSVAVTMEQLIALEDESDSAERTKG